VNGPIWPPCWLADSYPVPPLVGPTCPSCASVYWYRTEIGTGRWRCLDCDPPADERLAVEVRAWNPGCHSWEKVRPRGPGELETRIPVSKANSIDHEQTSASDLPPWARNAEIVPPGWMATYWSAARDPDWWSAARKRAPTRA
jgi:hypothetical protein